jgi:hypothetical protein
MVLNDELIMQFVKATKDPEEKKAETTVYGTIVESDDKYYVQIDGSEILTPIAPFSSTSDIQNKDRVTVLIKNHRAVVTGNLSQPAARFTEVSGIGTNVDKLNVNKLDAETASITYATIENLNATNASIGTLEADVGEFKNLATYKLDAIDAKIENLEVGNFDAVYANVDFSNIGKAAMEYFYAQSGLIKNVTVGDQTITGQLVGVTISGDRLIGNTVIADKLVIKGSDGLYYKLNTDGMKVETEQTDENSLNGQIIKAKSITATKIDVKDLVAFDATIGGFNITDSAIYSGVKESVNNTTRGIYLGKDGQIAIGDANNYLKYYKDTDGSYKLAISAKSIAISTGTDVETAISNLQNGIDSIEIGGRNMVENSDFSSDTIGPWRAWGDATSGTRKIVTISSHPQFTTGVTVEKTSSGQWGYAQDNIPVVTGSKYILSAWFKVESSDGDTTIMCQQGNSTDHWTSDEISIETVGTTTWYRLCHKFTAVSTSTNVYVGMQGSGSGKVTFTGVQLEKGDAMTDWTPYIENVRVGGTNLLRGTKTLDNAYWVNNGGTVLSDTVEGGALYSVSTSWNDIAYVKLSDIEIELNTDYTISWYAKASSDAYLPRMHFYCDTNTVPIVTRYGSSYEKTVTTEWKRYSHTFQFTSMPTSRTHLRVEPSTSSSAPDTAYLIIGAFKLEKGNKATDYSVSPLDIDARITTVELTANGLAVSLQETNTKIDDIKIGGRNLLLDTSTIPSTFGIDYKYWSGYGTYTYVDNYKDGFCAAHVTDQWSGIACYLNPFKTLLSVGDTITFSCNIDNVSSNDAPLSFYLMQFLNGTRVYHADVSSEGLGILKAGDSTRLSYTWTLDQATADLMNSGGSVRFTIQVNNASSYELYFYAPKLEHGNKPTDWTPAPEDIDTGIAEAAKTASNFMSYDSANGLQVGNKSAGSWSGFRTQITSAAFNILNSAGTVLASYGEKLIELGKNATDAVIKFCGGKGRIEYSEDYLQLAADSVRLKGIEMASLYSNYTDSNGVFRNGAVHAAPADVTMTAGGGSDNSSVHVKPTNIQMTTDNFYLTGVMNDSGNGGTYVSFTKGTSGIWTYKKYANGDLEMWGSYAVSNLECTTAMGNMYRTAVFSPTAFPFTIYNPVVTASYESEGYGAFLWATTKATTAKPSNYYLVRPTSTTIANGLINFHVFGKWKT